MYSVTAINAPDPQHEQAAPCESFILTHPRHPGLAWDGDNWVRHTSGVPWPGFTLLVFDSEEAADDYATEHFLYPRVG